MCFSYTLGCMSTNRSVMGLPEAPHLKKKDSYPSQQLSVANSSSSRGGLWCHWPASVLDFRPTWAGTCLVPAVTLSVSSHAWVSCSVRKILLPCHQPHLALKIFLSILNWSLRNGRCDIHAPLRAVWSLLFSAPWPVVGPCNFAFLNQFKTCLGLNLSTVFWVGGARTAVRHLLFHSM